MNEIDTDHLLNQAKAGNSAATRVLLTRYRSRVEARIQDWPNRQLLKRLADGELSDRLMDRISTGLPKFLKQRPVNFADWVNRLVRDELHKLDRQLEGNETAANPGDASPQRTLSDEHARKLTDRLLAGDRKSPLTKPSTQAVRQAFAILSPTDQQLLLMRCVERLDISEIQDVLGISEAEAKARFRHAVQRLAQNMREFS
jgi:DNA-directed RNA polymerase specialized sigma24 family protein